MYTLDMFHSGTTCWLKLIMLHMRLRKCIQMWYNGCQILDTTGRRHFYSENGNTEITTRIKLTARAVLRAPHAGLGGEKYKDYYMR